MSVEIKDIEDVSKSINADSALLSSICVLPSNYRSSTDPDDYYYESSLLTLMKLAQQNGLSLKIVGKQDDFHLLEKRFGEWIAPILVIGSFYFSQNPMCVSIAISMIANYLTLIFRGIKNPTVNLTILARHDKHKKTRLVTYKGSIDGLKELPEIVKQTFLDMEKGE